MTSLLYFFCLCLLVDESDSFQRIIRDILEILLRIVPGSTEALYFIARIHLLLGDAVGAEAQLLKAIQKSKTDLKVINTEIIRA